MSYQKLLQRVIGSTLVVLLLVGCGAPAATPVAPLATPVPPTATPEPPTATPTPVPPTATPTPPDLNIDLEGLIAYFPFDGDANDASGKGHHGTVHGATLTTDRNEEDGKAYYFDGEDDHISVMDSPDFDIHTGDMTVLAWVLYEFALDKKITIISHTNGLAPTDGWWWFIYRSKATRFMKVTMADTEHNVNPPQVNTWAHLAFVKEGSKIVFYIDGIAQGGPIDRGRPIIDSDGELRIGMEGSTYGENFFVGKIDELGFYNRALSADEIIAVMNAR